MTHEFKFKPDDDTIRRDPYPTYARMRAECPFHRTTSIDGDPEIMVTRYEDVVAVLKDDKRFTVDMAKVLPPEMTEQMLSQRHIRILTRYMLTLDGPEHHRLRSIVQKTFTPRMIERLRPRVQQIADDLIDQIVAKGELELVNDFSFPLPAIVICEMLGVPPEDRDQFRQWGEELTHSTSLDAMMAAEPLVEKFSAYCRALFDKRRAEPQDDLITALIQAEVDGDRLNEEELIAMTVLILFAGHETTLNLITNSLVMLLTHPDQLALLKARPELIGNATEEFLRFNTPVQSPSGRWATEDVKLGDTLIERGEAVVTVLGSANRDPQLGPNPDVFDITRAPSKHMGFGIGVHYCLGAPLARLEVEIAIPTLLRRLPNLRLAIPAEALSWEPGFMRMLKILPLTF